jgi:hypothetical protein
VQLHRSRLHPHRQRSPRFFVDAQTDDTDDGTICDRSFRMRNVVARRSVGPSTCAQSFADTCAQSFDDTWTQSFDGTWTQSFDDTWALA